MKQAKKQAYIGNSCVACGCCLKTCPLKAISIPTGVKALVNSETCVGCGKCVKICPAGIIEIKEKNEVS